LCKKFTKNPFWKDSRSFKVIDVDKFKKPVPVLVMISSMYMYLSATAFTLHEIIAVK